MKYFAKFDDKNILVARYIDEINPVIPPESIEISEDLFFKTINENDGVWMIGKHGELEKIPYTPDSGVHAEQGWVNDEIKRSADEIYKIQDSDPQAVGTEAEWRAYRVSLRSWPQSDKFPNKDYRPIAPGA